MDQYNCDYCVHGDDVTTMSDGSDCYALVKSAGRYMEYPRTEGISTTDLVGRMLELLKGNKDGSGNEKLSKSPSVEQLADIKISEGPLGNTKKFLDLFASHSLPKKGDKIVYIDGPWDLFHAGHISMLERARALGDYLIVGVFSDRDAISISNEVKVMTLHERALSLLACRVHNR